MGEQGMQTSTPREADREVKNLGKWYGQDRASEALRRCSEAWAVNAPPPYQP